MTEPTPPLRPRVRFNAVAVLFAAAALAFLLPFGTVSCDEQTVSFTGLELATHHVQADPGAAFAPDKGLAGQVEDDVGADALLALVCAVFGIFSAAVLGRGGGFALAASLFLLLLPLDAVLTPEADVESGIGYWLALGCAAGAGALRLVDRQRQKEEGLGPPPQGRARRFALSALLAGAAFGVFAIVDGVTANDPTGGAGSANVDFETEDWGPAWSPDGRWVAFASNRGEGGIHLVRPDGSCLRRVIDGEQVAWSPDARRLAVIQGDDEDAHLVVAAADGGRPRVVARGDLSTPQWSADGKRIYVERPTGAFTSATFALALDTGRLTRLAPPWVEPSDPRWSIAAVSESGGAIAPDGKRYVFMSSDDPTVPIGELGEKLYLRRVGEPRRTRLTNPSHAGDHQPAWSSDGSMIAFQRSGEIAVMAADGSGTRILTGVGGAVEPSWSPDGKSIVFSRELNGTGGLFGGNASALAIVDVATGKVRKLTWGLEALGTGPCAKKPS